jgi:hypothetical protein
MERADVLSLAIVVGVFAAGFISAMAVIQPNPGQQGQTITGAMVAQLPCMDTAGCSMAEVDTDSSTIYLTSGCRRLSIITNELQTYSINTGIHGIRGSRPTTHDSIQDVFEIFGIEPLILKIEKMEHGTYFAKLAMRQGSRILDMDIRPSDAVAIAVRTGTPIYVNRTLMEEEGELIC